MKPNPQGLKENLKPFLAVILFCIIMQFIACHSLQPVPRSQIPNQIMPDADVKIMLAQRAAKELPMTPPEQSPASINPAAAAETQRMPAAAPLAIIVPPPQPIYTNTVQYQNVAVMVGGSVVYPPFFIKGRPNADTGPWQNIAVVPQNSKSGAIIVRSTNAHMFFMASDQP